MAYIEEKHICYFCEDCFVNVPEQDHITIEKYNNIWICHPELAGIPSFTYCYKFREPCQAPALRQGQCRHNPHC